MMLTHLFLADKIIRSISGEVGGEILNADWYRYSVRFVVDPN